MGSGFDPYNIPPGHPATTILAVGSSSVNANPSEVRSLAL